jgi:hypothetical protein
VSDQHGALHPLVQVWDELAELRRHPDVVCGDAVDVGGADWTFGVDPA